MVITHNIKNANKYKCNESIISLPTDKFYSITEEEIMMEML